MKYIVNVIEMRKYTTTVLISAEDTASAVNTAKNGAYAKEQIIGECYRHSDSDVVQVLSIREAALGSIDIDISDLEQ